MIYGVAFVVLVLAAARMTRVLVFDAIAQPLRAWVLRTWPMPSKLGKLVTCYWCAGFWLSGLCSIATHRFFPWNPLISIPLLAFATSYAVGVLLDREEAANGIGS